jgi:hypothetical protein
MLAARAHLGPCSGPEAITVNAAFHRLAFTDLFALIQELSSDADIAIVVWTARRRSADSAAHPNTFGTHDRSLRGVTAAVSLKTRSSRVGRNGSEQRRV